MNTVSSDNTTCEKSIENITKTKSLNLFHICVWLFVIGCFIGYVVEIVYAYVKHGHFINKQGMIYGPFNQIYGLGTVVFTLCIYKIRNCKKYILFFVSAVVGGIFEYICSYLQEIIFHSASWHYERFPLNINGRTNVIHMAFWGILGVLFFTFVFPAFVNLIAKIPSKILTPITIVLLIFMVSNLFISGCAVKRQSERISGEEATNVFEDFLDEHYDDKTLKEVYPNMKFIKKT